MVTICEWFGFKTTQMVFAGLASKSVGTVFSSLPLKLVATVFSNFATKLVVDFLVGPQNQGGGDFSGWASKLAASIW
jgi:hypothetical protein